MNFAKLFGKKGKSIKKEKNNPIQTCFKNLDDFSLLNKELEDKIKSLLQQAKSYLKIGDKDNAKKTLQIRRKYTDYQGYLESILLKILDHLISILRAQPLRELYCQNETILKQIKIYVKSYKKAPVEYIKILESKLDLCAEEVKDINTQESNCDFISERKNKIINIYEDELELKITSFIKDCINGLKNANKIIKDYIIGLGVEDFECQIEELKDLQNIGENEKEIKKSDLDNKIKFTKIESISINDNLNNQIKQLQNELKEEQSENEKLKKELKNISKKNENAIKNLEEENKNMKIHYENEINKLYKKIKSLEDEIINKNNELQNYKNNLNENRITSMKQGEYIISVNFMTMGNQDIANYSMACKNTDLFIRLEEKLYKDFPKYKDYEAYYEVSTRRIKRFKTIEENNIKNNDIIFLFVID